MGHMEAQSRWWMRIEPMICAPVKSRARCMLAALGRNAETPSLNLAMIVHVAYEIR